MFLGKGFNSCAHSEFWPQPNPKSYYHSRCLSVSNKDACQCQHVACNFILYVAAPSVFNAPCSLLILVNTYLFANIRPCIKFSWEFFWPFSLGELPIILYVFISHKPFRFQLNWCMCLSYPLSFEHTNSIFSSLVFQCLTQSPFYTKYTFNVCSIKKQSHLNNLEVIGQGSGLSQYH